MNSADGYRCSIELIEIDAIRPEYLIEAGRPSVLHREFRVGHCDQRNASGYPERIFG